MPFAIFLCDLHLHKLYVKKVAHEKFPFLHNTVNFLLVTNICVITTTVPARVLLKSIVP